jgi:hypothetical protein
MISRPLSFLLLFVAFLVSLAGCGADNPLNRQPVSGAITLDGQPMDHGSIEFSPQADDGVSSGAMIVDGEYSIPAEKGLPPGEYRVRIYSPEGGQSAPADGPPGPNMGPPAQERVPPNYNRESEIIVEVTAEGPNEFDYEIQSVGG